MDREAIDSATASLDRFAFKLWKTGLVSRFRWQLVRECNDTDARSTGPQMLICHFGVGGMVVIPHKTSTPPNVVKLLGLCSPVSCKSDSLRSTRLMYFGV